MATPCPKDTALCLLLGGHFGSNTVRTGRGWGISDPKNSNPLEILLQEFCQIVLNASEQGLCMHFGMQQMRRNKWSWIVYLKT